MASLLTPVYVGFASAIEPATFTPVADATVDSSSPDRNYGSRTNLRADASPTRVAFVRFDVQGVADFSNATLRLYFLSRSNAGVEARPVGDNAWEEMTITYNSAPGFGAVVGASGPAGSGTWGNVDVTSIVTTNGLVTIAITTPSSTAVSLGSRESATAPQLIIGQVPPPTLSPTLSPTPSAAQSPTPTPSASSSLFIVSIVSGGFQAASPTTGVTFTGSLKSVVERAVAELERTGSGTVRFEAGDFDLGSDHFEFYSLTSVTFEGQGMGVTTIRNSTNASADTEVFDVVVANQVTIRDLAVSAGGSGRTTSDAIDFDNGSNTLIERVKVTGSRARGIVFDGKDAGASAHDNVVRDCVITGIPGDGIELLASSSNRVEGCTIVDVGGHGIQVNKSSTSAAQPNKKSTDNVVQNNTIDNAGQDGINVNSGDGNQIIGNMVRNSSDDTSGRDGIRIASTNSITCNDNLVDRNVSTDNQPVKTQTYGLNIANAECHRTAVGSNDFSGNRLGAINDGGTGTIYGGGPGGSEPSPTPGPTPGPTPAPAGAADSYVDASQPTTNFSGSSQVRVDGSPVVVTYLKFSVQVTGPVTRAVLRMYANSNHSVGYRVHGVVDTTWNEGTLTYANAPSYGPEVGSSGAFSAGTWVEVDVTSLITGSGTISLALSTASSTAMSLGSRESGANAPQLVIEAS